MIKMADATSVPVELKQPLSNMLLALADDEFILGYWDSEWTGVAPMLEEDVACSSIAQDEIGHARLFYQEVAALTGVSPDDIAYGRQVEDYRQIQLVEHQRGNWAFTIARRFYYETADQIRLASLQDSVYMPLTQAIAKIQREETYHQMHIGTWLQRLANGTPEARQLLEQALVQLWPDALGIFEPFADEETLLAAGILPCSSEVLLQQWLRSIVPIITQFNLPVPLERVSYAGVVEEQDRADVFRSTMPARYGGRQGQHITDFADLWEQMTMVYRLDPHASW